MKKQPARHSSIRILVLAISVLSASHFAGATIYIWTNSVASIWSGTTNWTPNGSPGTSPADSCIFTNTLVASNTVNNTVDSSLTISSLSYFWKTPLAQANNWLGTQIPSGGILSVTNLTIGSTSSAVNTVSNSVGFFGAGTLNVLGSLNVGINGSSSADSGSWLDLSHLSNFVFNAVGGTINIGMNNRSAANFNLAATNNILAGTLNLNSSSVSSSASGTTFLGTVANIFQAGTINLAGNRNSSTLKFQGATGGLYVRGNSGSSSRTEMIIMNRQNVTTGSSSLGNMSLNGHSVDMLIDVLNVAQNNDYNVSGTDTAGGTLSFDNGIIDATTINMAYTSSEYSGTEIANATNNVGTNATLIVGLGGMIMAKQDALSGGTAEIASGYLNITNGMVICSNGITATANANGGNSYIVNWGGKINLVGGSIGSTTNPITSLITSNATYTFNVDGTLTNLVVSQLSEYGTNIINISSLPPLTSYPNTNVLFYGATPMIASPVGLTFGLGTLPSNRFGVGTTNYTGFLTNDGSGNIMLIVTAGPTTYNIPPIVTSISGNVLEIPGGTANFLVVAAGSAPLTYQWKVGGVPIANATNATYSITNITIANAGSYTVVVENSVGTVTSSAMNLTLLSVTGYESSLGLATGLSSVPQAYWPLNESSGPTAYDVIGGNNGTNSSAVVYGSAGPSPTNAPVAFSQFPGTNKAYTFNGSSAIVYTPSTFAINASEFSVVTWIRNTNTTPSVNDYNAGFRNLVGQGPNTWRVGTYLNNATFTMNGYVGGGIGGTKNVMDGAWHQVVAVYDGSTFTASLYVDGVLDYSATDSSHFVVVPDGSDITFGSQSASSRFGWDGNLADVAIFSYALSANEAAALYVNSGAPLPTPTLAYTSSGGALTFTWSGAYQLQVQTNSLSTGISTNWFYYPGGNTSPVTVPVDPTQPTVFFRLAQ